MHIKRFTASIHQAYLSRYIALQEIKAAKKGQSNMHCNSRGMYSSNFTVISDTSLLKTRCKNSPESNPTTPQKSSKHFMGDNNTQKTMTYNETRLTIAITDINISEGLSFNLYQKPRFKKVLDLSRTV